MGSAAICFGAVEIRPEQRELRVAGAPAVIGARAFDLLMALVERRERVVSKGELLDLVWPGLVVEENNLHVQVATLRKLLGAPAITTVPGRGYRFTLAAQAEPAPAAPAAPVAPARDDPAQPHNLHAEGPPLLGRDDELQLALALLRSHRLVTICGAGGIGKTRLAQALARACLAQADDGVWWVELAPLGDGSLLPAAVAQALGLRIESDHDPVATLQQLLARQRLVLVLDNCEHLAAACAALADRLLQAAPALSIVATSQQPLKLPVEQLLRLGPLALPAPDADEARALQSGAVQVFVERVRRLQPRFQLDGANLAATLDICRRLDGVALALELAAARVPLLGVAGVRDRLRERLRLLAAAPGVVPPRQRTLHAALDWSHALLDPDAQTVLRRLAVFSGGFTVEAAQQVASDERLDAWTVLEQLAVLADHSLLDVDAGERARCTLLETTRAYAQERLAAAGEAQALARRHARWCAGHFAQLADALFDGRLSDDAFIAARADELDNLRAALATSLHEDDTAGALDLLVHSAPFGFLLPPGSGVAEMLDQLQPRVSDAGARAWLHYAGRHYLRLQWAGSDPVQARRAAIAALPLIDEPRRRAFTCCLLAQDEYRHPDGEQGARALIDQAQALEQPHWPRWLRMRRLLTTGMCLGFATVAEPAAALLREMDAAGEGSGRSAFMLREMQAWALLNTHRNDEALAALQDLLDRGRRERRDSHRMWIVLDCMAKVLLECERPAEAHAVLEEILAHSGARGLWPGSAMAFAEYASVTGRRREAALLLGFEHTLSERDGRVPTPREQRMEARIGARLRAAHDEGTVQGWIAEGRRLDETAARTALARVAAAAAGA